MNETFIIRQAALEAAIKYLNTFEYEYPNLPPDLTKVKIIASDFERWFTRAKGE